MQYLESTNERRKKEKDSAHENVKSCSYSPPLPLPLPPLHLPAFERVYALLLPSRGKLTSSSILFHRRQLKFILYAK